jgi:hypothetical protein
MPFKDTQEGQTHYENDNCGMKEHNEKEKCACGDSSKPYDHHSEVCCCAVRHFSQKPADYLSVEETKIPFFGTTYKITGKCYQDWEEEFEKVTCSLKKKSDQYCALCDMCKHDIKDFIRLEIEKARIIYYDKGRENKAPMGVSQWQQHGEKYGYWEFFEKKVLDKIEVEEKAKDVARDMTKKFKIR